MTKFWSQNVKSKVHVFCKLKKYILSFLSCSCVLQWNMTWSVVSARQLLLLDLGKLYCNLQVYEYIV